MKSALDAGKLAENMIKKIDHKDLDTAREIRAVFQASYAVEARLLKASDFPPLKRPLEGFTESSTEFFGYYSTGKLSGVVEVDQKTDKVHIQSLVVQPEFFRQGIGRALVNFVFENYSTPLFTVETGAENGPATRLYLQTGFMKLEEYETGHGIRKARFEKR